MPLLLGYLEIRTDVGTATEARHVHPLPVTVAAAPLFEPDPGLFGGTWFDLPGGGAQDVFAGATITQNDADGQRLRFVISGGDGHPPNLEARILINTSFATTIVSTPEHPSPTEGEAFISFGCRTIGTGTLGFNAAELGVENGTGFGGRDAVGIVLAASFGQPRTYLVGQFRARTEPAVADDAADTPYRRAIETDVDGMRIALDVVDLQAPEFSTIRLDLRSPRTGDAPIRQLACTAGTTAGDVPTGPTNRRRYQVTWVYDNGNESAPTPLSAPVTTTTGSVTVPLPVWTPPTAPTPPPPGQIPGSSTPLPVVRRRVYRTVTSPTGDDGEAFLIEEVPDNVATSYTDVTGDDDLGDPLLTDLEVALRRTEDVTGNEELATRADLSGTLELLDRSEAADGTPRSTGDRYTAGFFGVPARADIRFTTRPLAGRPRLDWRTTAVDGDDDGGLARLTLRTEALDHRPGFRPLTVHVDELPAAVGLDWWAWGATRLRVQAGHPADLTEPLDEPAGLVAFHQGTTTAEPLRRSRRPIAVRLSDDEVRATAAEVRSLRILLGLPRPAGEAGEHHAVLDDGVAVDARFGPMRRGGTDRSLSFRRTSGVGSVSNLDVRVGNLHETIGLDVRPGGPITGRLAGTADRVSALLQAPEDAVGDESASTRHDGVWLAAPRIGPELTFRLDTDRSAFVIDQEAPVRLDAVLRRPAGLGTDGDVRLRGLAATLRVGAGITTVSVPPSSDASAAELVTLATPGASGRVGVTTRTVDDTRDRYRAARATPQVVADFTTAGLALGDLATATARVLGLRELGIARSPAPGPHRVGLAPERANRAFRAQVDVTDARFDPPSWALAKVRAGSLASTTSLTADLDARSFVLDASEAFGPVTLFAEPAIVPTDGAAADTAIGIGLARATVESVPTHLELDLLGPGNTRQSEPFNWSTPAGWRHSGFRILPNGELVIRGLQLIGIDRTRPSPRNHYWSNTAAALFRIAVADGDAFGPVWLWTPSAGLPGAGAASEAWDEPDSAIGFRMESGSRATLQLNSYLADLGDTSPPIGWASSSFSWLLQAEFQMEDYGGEGTLTPGSLSPTGDPDAGPGRWWLRLPDAAPFSGQVVFGNTGGWISSRPAIFASFTPSPPA